MVPACHKTETPFQNLTPSRSQQIDHLHVFNNANKWSLAYVIIRPRIIKEGEVLLIWHSVIVRHRADHLPPTEFLIHTQILNFYSSPQRYILWGNLGVSIYRQDTHSNAKIRHMNRYWPPMPCTFSLSHPGWAQGWVVRRLTCGLEVGDPVHTSASELGLGPQGVDSLFLDLARWFQPSNLPFPCPPGGLLVPALLAHRCASQVSAGSNQERSNTGPAGYHGGHRDGSLYFTGEDMES